MSLALSELFGFTHIQSDDVEAKNTKKLFLLGVSNAVLKDPVVIADR